MFNVFGKPIVWKQNPDELNQSLTGVPSGSPVFSYELGSSNSLVWNFSADEFIKVHSALLVGAELLYPEQSHDVVFALEKMLIFPEEPSAGSGGDVEAVIISDVKSENTAGGTFTADGYRQRDINTISSTPGWVALSLFDDFVLYEGTFELIAYAMAYRVDENHLRLYDIDNSVELTQPMSQAFLSAYAHNRPAMCYGIVTVEDEISIELQHYCTRTQGTNGFGLAADITGRDEVYSWVIIRKIG